MAYSASDISKAVFVATLFAVIVVGNALVGHVLLKFRSHLLRNRPTYQFILNIVLSDLVVGLLTMPFAYVRELLDQWIFGTMTCKIIKFIEITGLPRCKNLTRFSLFVSFCFAVRYCLKCFCFLCFTSSVSFTGSYTEVKPR